MLTSVLIDNRTQEMGDIVIDSFPDGAEWLQIDAECLAPQTTGKLYIKFKTPGMSSAKNLIDQSGNDVFIDLTKPYPLRIDRISISSLIISPSSVTGDTEFSVAVVWEDD